MNFDHKILPLALLGDLKIDKTNKIVLVGGCFDILHYGHISFIQKARTVGDILVVLLESDEFIRRVKKKKPVHNQQQRAEVLAALGYVDYVILLPFLKNPDVDYKKIVKEISPSVIAYSVGDIKKEKKIKLADEVHAKTVSIPYLSLFSSSQLITYASIFRD